MMKTVGIAIIVINRNQIHNCINHLKEIAPVLFRSLCISVKNAEVVRIAAGTEMDVFVKLIKSSFLGKVMSSVKALEVSITFEEMAA